MNRNILMRYITGCLFIALFSCGNNNLLKEVKHLDYPSASGVEYLAHRFYIIGDDANNILVTDEQFKPVDSIPLYNYTERRIPKAVKADLESIALMIDNRFLVTGSGSVSPSRNAAWLVNGLSKQKDSLRLDTFYTRLRAAGIKELNIEGLCRIPGSLLLVNRGSKGYPKNQLIFTNYEFWNKQATAGISIAKIGYSEDTSSFSGVSGAAYSGISDRLLLSVSTEDTRSAYEDGTIGKSYIWIINNFTAKRGWAAINPDKIIDLEKVDAKFKGHKIESVCIENETIDMLYLVLAADNDNGSSTLFRLVIEKT